MGLLDQWKASLANKMTGEDTPKVEKKKDTYLTGTCPNCGNRLEFQENDNTVTCYCCDSTLSVKNLMPKGSDDVVKTATDGILAVMQGVESPDSAMMYLQNYFETYNWDLYGRSSQILLYEIENMAQKTKIKNGASATVWLLDFECVYVPLSKKVAAIQAMEKTMGEEYSETDNTRMLKTFDVYRNVVNAVVAQKDALIKRMEAAIRFAENLKLDAAKLKEMQTGCEKLKAAISVLKKVKRPSDVAAVEKAKAAINKRKEAELAAKGVDVKAVYEMACEYAQNGSRKAALELFESIRGYADSIEYIERINTYFNFYYETFSFCGKHFIFKDSVQEAAQANEADNKNKAKAAPSEEEEYHGFTHSLYEIVDGVESEEALVKGITQIIGVYGSCLYYVKHGKRVCYYDIDNQSETSLDSCKEKYPTNKDGLVDFYWNTEGNAVYMRRRLENKEEKAGCIKAAIDSVVEPIKEFFSKKKKHDRRNNFSVLCIDLKRSAKRSVIRELVDVYDFNGEKMFYTVADEEAEELKTTLMVCNLVTGETNAVLSENCDIQEIYGDKVVYALHKPNDYNKDLHVYDLSDGSDVLIEKNILDYFQVIQGKVYYTVGNETYSSLFANSFDGTSRKEIMLNAEPIFAVQGDWMYVIKGKYRNRVLMKISSDGAQRILVCTQFQRLAKVTDLYYYYVDTNDDLRVVRTDGKENTLIAEGVDVDNMIVDEEYIYYLRSEDIDQYSYGKSLYRMSIAGHNVCKIAFNVKKMAGETDEDKIYVSKAGWHTFEVTETKGHKKPKKHEEVHYLTEYMTYDKASDTFDTYYTKGMPKPDKPKTGCLASIKNALFGKPSVTYKEIPPKVTYRRAGLAKAGSVHQEQKTEAAVEEALQKIKKQNSAKKSMGLLWKIIIVIVMYSMAASLFMTLMSGRLGAVGSILLSIALLAVGAVCLLFGTRNARKGSVKLFTMRLAAIACTILFIGGFIGGVKSCAAGGNGEYYDSAKKVSVGINEVEQENYGDLYLEFSPNEDGQYNVFVLRDTDKEIEIRDEDRNWVAGGDTNTTVCEMRRGEKYYIIVTPNNSYNRWEVDVHIVRVGDLSSNGGSSSNGDDNSSSSNGGTANGSSFDTAYTVETGSVSVSISKGGRYIYVKFKPTSSGTYTFSSSDCSKDLDAVLYNSSQNSLAEDEESGDFNIEYELSRTKTYYLKIELPRTYTSDISFTLTIEKLGN